MKLWQTEEPAPMEPAPAPETHEETKEEEEESPTGLVFGLGK